MVVDAELRVCPNDIRQVLVDHVWQLLHDLPRQSVHNPLVIVLRGGKGPRCHGEISSREPGDPSRDFVAELTHELGIGTTELREGPSGVHHVLELEPAHSRQKLPPDNLHEGVVADVQRRKCPHRVGQALGGHVGSPLPQPCRDRSHHLGPLELHLRKSPSGVGQVLLCILSCMCGHLLGHGVKKRHGCHSQHRKSPRAVGDILPVHVLDVC
mmetsp:Transcript_152461/g.487166  ORF Transcript_152461/g.487166 Transcript_152461/m.487166 type:complete len:212 (-) Transcript_152461:790-1425(-)